MRKRIIFLSILIFISIFIVGFSFNLESNRESRDKYKLKVSDGDSWDVTWGNELVDEWAWDSVLDLSNNIYITGVTNITAANGRDILLLKFNSLGEAQWNTTWGGPGYDSGESIGLDSAHNIYVAGLTDNRDNIILIKFNNSGSYQWYRTWGGTGQEYAGDLVIDSSDNIYLVGTTEISGLGDEIFLLKYNTSGDLIYNTTWGGSGDDYASDLALDDTGNIYIAGGVENIASKNVTIAKFNNSGDYQWHQTWGGSESEYAFSLALDSSGNIYVSGHFYSFGSTIGIVKFNNTGDIQWYRTWGAYEGHIYDITVDLYDNIYLAGFYSGDLIFIEYDGTGTQQRYCIWGGGLIESAVSIKVDSTNNIYVVGSGTKPGLFLESDIILFKNPKECKSLNNVSINGYNGFIMTAVISIVVIILGKMHKYKIKKNHAKTLSHQCLQYK